MEKDSCTCECCIAACKQRPCWGTPQEMKKIIDAGFGNKLMLDWWDTEALLIDRSSNFVWLLSPAIREYEAKQAPETFPFFMQCVFQNKQELCDLHDLNLKPSEGKRIWHEIDDSEAKEIHLEIMRTWRTSEGKELVNQWRQEHGV
jgi:hypothetical protein